MAAATRMARARGEVGAYGLRLENVERARSLLVPAPSTWPRLSIHRTVGPGEAEHDWFDDTTAVIKLQNGGEIVLDRGRETATFVVPRRLRTAELVHPLLAPVAAVMAYWLGRESFHASAFVADGRVWALIGERGSGKSTTVARLALEGVGIACDDLLVIEGSRAFSGPRSVDLRREASERLGVGEPLGVVGARERWRLKVAEVPSSLQLAGWVFLKWGAKIQAGEIRPGDRLARLHVNRAVNLPPRDPAALLALASLPAWELTRPEGWDSLPGAVECLLETVG
jgi:hypothetical protein